VKNPHIITWYFLYTIFHFHLLISPLNNGDYFMPETVTRSRFQIFTKQILYLRLSGFQSHSWDIIQLYIALCKKWKHSKFSSVDSPEYGLYANLQKARNLKSNLINLSAPTVSSKRWSWSDNLSAKYVYRSWPGKIYEYATNEKTLPLLL